LTNREQIEIVVYVLLQMHVYSTGGNALWEQAVKDGVCQHPRGDKEKERTAHTMRERFVRYLVKADKIWDLGLDRYICKVFAEYSGNEPRDAEEKRKFRAARRALIEKHVDKMAPPVVRLWEKESRQR
jgi:hypothetical protein